MNEHIDLDFLRACLREGGALALAERERIRALMGHPGGMDATVKADRSPVTEVDKAVETLLIERIRSRYPNHAVLSEETGLHPRPGEMTWVIDPIDGTRSFAAGLPVWGVSIGVLRGGEPLCGGLYLPVTGEMFWGTREQAYYNDAPLPPAPLVDLESPLTFLAVPSNFYRHFDVTFPRARSMGSTAAHLAYVAIGAAAGALLSGISLWDMAGLLPALAATGVELAALDGARFDAASLLDGRPLRAPLLAAHPRRMEALRAAVRRKQR